MPNSGKTHATEVLEEIGEGESASGLLRILGLALLSGAAWEGVMNDARWAHRTLYIAYTHDKLGTPDNVEGVGFTRADAEGLAMKAAQRLAATNPLNRQFYKFKVIEWPLAALAVREARDGFHHDVVRHLVAQIKAGLANALPQGALPVTIGNIGGSDDGGGDSIAYIDFTGRRIVLWEDCRAAGAEGSTMFATMDDPPLCGLMNADGDVIVPAEFEDVFPLSEGLAVAWRDGLAGYIDAKGNVVHPFIYEDAADCFQDVLLIKSDGLWGAIARDGRELITPRYESLEHDVGNEALRASLNGKHAYLSLRGELLAGYSELPLDLIEHSFAAERSVFIAKDSSFGQAQHVLVDALGRRIGMKGFAAIHYAFPEEGLLCATVLDGEASRHGYINLHGDTVIPFRYSQAGNFSEGLAAAAVENPALRYGYIDKRGEWVIDPVFHHAGEFHQGLAAASGSPRRKWPWQIFGGRSDADTAQEPRYGFIDRKGRWEIEPRFLEVKAFSEGLAAVRLEKGWGYVDIGGSLAVPGPYQEAGAFKHGVARVARRFSGPLRWGLIDACGREIIPLRFDWLSYPQSGLITACDEFGLWGCFTLFGNIVAPFVYREAGDLQAALSARGG